ncbi:3-phosphoserine/phosphohydroxythreonine transaminase [Xiamenia xianingshaonis]|uniref:Phosphoserine aminotransferase n=1 Tax=Xiamenia xianingshaonis TaxID=2682776 RepID=A0A9E6MR45_9ACTN|nr:3-phosphoserine/phosphohydroxythreonine transaminase [Xiamenia xianingshaonis]NGM17342.1 3-phosphoserine/phosphohydroxythreonine transaminase [Eggerthellaceae bacterium zg-893]NHM14381.1 3-phosphoserine/phosphohydroxythreonine transaminase [Xiamenia xianingshaonis]NHM16004.1 3-phosphoserine/phosphohydroxythreonine transaminase [Xiamenia xianingshaonis]QTU84858.1 3-phosphoserine/phosphohydroxythreonine transaminase [Xiamenia xianingshaonis]
MGRIYNFSAGPAVLPEEVLAEAAAEMLDYQGCGMSVMEMSHRSAAFKGIIETAEQDLRDLMGIPDNYRVLFLQGGASTQFAMIPMNLMTKHKAADYIVSGSWSKKAFKEAQLFGDARCVASSEDGNFSYVPDVDAIEFSADADYVYICQNETIYGTLYHKLPETGDVPLVADVSSCFLSAPVNVADYGLIYGGAQKNIGPAGVTIVIVRDDLIGEPLPGTPTMLRYDTHAKNGSLYNTPPAYGIYVCGKVFQWLKANGGLEAQLERNEKKAKLLYDYLDSSKLFKATARKEDRSIMNVPFVTGSDELDAKFVAEAKLVGLESIKGHRSVGGMRASIYNAMPYEGVKKLVEFMEQFEKENA